LSVPHAVVTGSPTPTFVICQELMYALTIHSFQKVEGGVWRERLVDVAVRDNSKASEATGRVRSAVVRQYATTDAADANPAASPFSSSSNDDAPGASPRRSLD
jgi:hypothetical protein